MISHQIENVSRETDYFKNEPNGNSGAEKCKFWNEKTH